MTTDETPPHNTRMDGGQKPEQTPGESRASNRISTRFKPGNKPHNAGKRLGHDPDELRKAVYREARKGNMTAARIALEYFEGREATDGPTIPAQLQALLANHARVMAELDLDTQYLTDGGQS